jgi:micrococcal nuclease
VIQAWTCLIGVIAGAVSAPASPLPQLQGRVIGIVDGDTLKIQVNRTPITVRLYGVDAPEKKQLFGAKASAFVRALALGKDVTFTVRAKDRNRRLIADVVLNDGRSLSQELVKTGHAWWFRRYAPQDRRLNQLENEARRARLGLWVDPRAIAPWEWRHFRGGHRARPPR